MKRKRLSWRLGLSAGALLLIALAMRNRANDHVVFGPEASVADMIAGLASDVRRQPRTDTFTASRYTTESARRHYRIKHLTFGLFPLTFNSRTEACDTVSYDRSKRELTHANGTQGDQLFIDHIVTNVLPQTLFLVAKERGDWCSFRRHGCKDLFGCYDYRRVGVGNEVLGCCPG